MLSLPSVPVASTPDLNFSPAQPLEKTPEAQIMTCAKCGIFCYATNTSNTIPEHMFCAKLGAPAKDEGASIKTENVLKILNEAFANPESEATVRKFDTRDVKSFNYIHMTMNFEEDDHPSKGQVEPRHSSTLSHLDCIKLTKSFKQRCENVITQFGNVSEHVVVLVTPDKTANFEQNPELCGLFVYTLKQAGCSYV